MKEIKRLEILPTEQASNNDCRWLTTDLECIYLLWISFFSFALILDLNGDLG
jgi:hypothetical protein